MNAELAAPASKLSNRRVLLAFVIWAAIILAMLLSIVIQVTSADPEIRDDLSQTLIAIVVAGFPYATVGMLVRWKQPQNRLGWIFLGIGAVLAHNMLTEPLARESNHTYHRLTYGLQGIAAISWTIAIAATITLVPLLFPTGRTTSSAWKWVERFAIGSLLVLYVPLLIITWVQGEAIANDADPRFNLFTGGVVLIGLAGTLLSSIACIASVFIRLRRATGIEEQQLKYFAFSSAMVFVLLLGMMLTDGWVSTICNIATLILPVSIGIAIIRHRLFDIDLIISRTLLWATTTGFVLLIYILVVGVVGEWIGAEDRLFPSLIATGIVAVMFQPVRARLQRWVNQWVYGDRDDPYRAVSRLALRMDQSVDAAEILETIVESVAQATRSPFTQIELWNSQSPVVSWGKNTSVHPPFELPLMYLGEQIGVLTVARRTGGAQFSDADRHLLNDLARQIGIAAHAINLTVDLQTSRERIVTAREEERRRLRNDLHDGLGPVLSGLKLRAETARNLIVQNPEVDSLLADIASQTELAVADVRRLVYSLRPPALDELGLVPALREIAAQSRIPVVVEAPDTLPALPAAVEVAAFRIAQEALTNVGRHSEARHCHLRLTVSADVLQIEVRDDGVGFYEEARSGVGLHSMRERAMELGGSTVFESNLGRGTSLVTRLPLLFAPDAPRLAGA